MSKLELLRGINATASFNRWAGFDVVHAGDGECEVRLRWRPDEMGQYGGFLHAGMIAALLDTACGFAAVTVLPAGQSVLASHFAVSCLAVAGGVEFVAVGRVMKAGRRQIFTAGELHVVGSERQLVATATTILVPIVDPAADSSTGT